jgi:hypothetical protein
MSRWYAVRSIKTVERVARSYADNAARRECPKPAGDPQRNWHKPHDVQPCKFLVRGVANS